MIDYKEWKTEAWDTYNRLSFTLLIHAVC